MVDRNKLVLLAGSLCQFAAGARTATGEAVQSGTALSTANGILTVPINAADINVQKSSTSLAGATPSVDVTLPTPVDVNTTFVLVGLRAIPANNIASQMVRTQLINSLPTASICLAAANVRAAALKAVQSETAQSSMPLDIPMAPVASVDQPSSFGRRLPSRLPPRGVGISHESR